MPMVLTHAVAGLAIGASLRPARTTWRFWVAGALCAMAPDLDYLAVPFGFLDYPQVFGGHRAFTHSLAFALLMGTVATTLAFRGAAWNGVRARVWVCCTLAAVSHGVVDAFASYGPGIAFLFPFSDARYASPWRPIGAVEGGGWDALGPLLVNELAWGWVPWLALAATASAIRSLRRSCQTAA